METTLKYQIVERHADHAIVRFLNPKWDKTLVLTEKQEVTEVDETGAEVTKIKKVKVDTNAHQHHEHRVVLPAPIEGEDYESVTLPRRIEEVGRGVAHKMEIKARANAAQ